VAQQALQAAATAATAAPGSSPKTALKLSSFVQSAKITVLDKATNAVSDTVVWDAEKAAEPCDAFEVKRCGDKEVRSSLAEED
jgi:hypothetical protein